MASKLPHDIATAAVELMSGPLLDNPRRIGKPLAGELTGVYSAHLGMQWRILYEIDDEQHAVIVLDIQHRGNAYRPR